MATPSSSATPTSSTTPSSSGTKELTFEEKLRLRADLQNLPYDKIEAVEQIIKKSNPELAQQDDENELDIESLDLTTLLELDRFVTECTESKIKEEQGLGVKRDTPSSSTGKTSWPELEGEDADYALSVIKRENPSLEIILSLKQTGSPENGKSLTVHFNEEYEVTHTPTFGTTSWPDLVGKDPFYAAYVIHKANPNLYVFVTALGSALSRIPSSDRIRVWVGSNNKVVNTPTIETLDFYDV